MYCGHRLVERNNGMCAYALIDVLIVEFNMSKVCTGDNLAWHRLTEITRYNRARFVLTVRLKFSYNVDLHKLWDGASRREIKFEVIKADRPRSCTILDNDKTQLQVNIDHMRKFCMQEVVTQHSLLMMCRLIELYWITQQWVTANLLCKDVGLIIVRAMGLLTWDFSMDYVLSSH